MLEIPAVLQQDNQRTSSQNYARGFFRKLEIEEIKALARAPDPSAVELRYVERFQVETPLIRTQIPTSAPDNTRYIGLASNGVYDREGNLVGDAYSLFVRASAGHKRYAKHFTNPLRLNESGDPLSGDSNGGSTATTDTEYEQGHQNEEDDDQNENEADNDEEDEEDDEENDEEYVDDDEEKAAAKAAAEELDTEVAPTVGLYEQAIRIESLVKTTNVGRQIVTMEWGCHQLPRNTIAPKITQDSPQTVQLIEGTAPISNEVPISDAARKILSRSNYHEPLALEQDHHEDQHVTQHFIRRRSIQCLTTIMYTSLFRKQYDRAFKVLCLLMRERRVDLRLLWMPALELLVWRVREQGARKTPVDFLDWLIANYPDLSNHKIDKYRQLGRASTFIPIQIMVRLSLGHYRAAAEQAEQVVNTAMFNSDARCWALYGIALLKLDMEGNADKAEKCFQMVVKLGGVMSSIMSESAESGSDAQSESESAQSESESGESDASRSESEADVPSSSSSDEHNSEENETESPPTKRAKRDVTPESDTGNQSGSETESASQPFFSQGGQIGTELGSDSESEDARETSSQPFYSQGGPIGIQLGSDSEEASGNELSSQPVFTQVEKADSEPESESHNRTNGSHENENDSEPEDEPSNSQNETQSEPDVPREASEASEASETSDGEPEMESSQPFYSQGGIGAEMGSSESEIDV